MLKPSPTRQDARSRTDWVFLTIAIIVTTVAALGVHEVMLEGMHVPFPRTVGLPAWATYLNQSSMILAFVAFCRLAHRKLGRISIMGQCVLVTAIYVMLQETFRVMIIDSVLSNAWVYQIARVAPHVLYDVFLGSAVVVTASRLKSVWSVLAMVLAISGVGMVVIKPVIDSAFDPLFKSISFLDLPQIYQEPFSGHVLMTIYVTFIEAVIAAFVIAALVWPKLSRRAPVSLLQFVALLAFMKGSVLRFALDAFWVAGPLSTAFLSESQFFLEVVTMALLTGLSRQRLQARRTQDPEPRR